MEHVPSAVAREIAVALPEMVHVLKRYRSQLVVFDYFTFAAQLAAECCGIRAIRFHPTYAFGVPFHFVRDTMDGHLPGRFCTPQTLTEFDRIMKDVWIRYGLPSRSFRDLVCHSPDSQIVGLPKEFQPRSDEFGSDTAFVGPVFDALLSRAYFGADALAGPQRRPAIFVSFGTVFNVQPELYRNCLSALKGLDACALLAVGAGNAPLPAPSSRVKICQAVSLMDVMPTVDLLLTHGGMGSVMRALYWGTPLLVVPQFPEQWVTARQIERLELGRHVPREEATPQRLRDEVRRMLETTPAGCRPWRDRIRATGGCRQACDLILSPSAGQ